MIGRERERERERLSESYEFAIRNCIPISFIDHVLEDPVERCNDSK
jgi:hypothetical protein